MLQLIVLGLIPGTEMQLTFGQIIMAIAVFYGCILLAYEHRHHRRTDPVRQLEEVTL